MTKHAVSTEISKTAADVTANNQEPTFAEQLAKLTLTPKQQSAVNGLIAEIARREDEPKLTNPTLNGRTLVILLNSTRIAVGPVGGLEALDVRTYPQATTSFMATADLALQKQGERDKTKVPPTQAPAEVPAVTV